MIPQVGDYVIFNLCGIQLVGRVRSHLSAYEVGVESVFIEYNSRLFIEPAQNCMTIHPERPHIKLAAPRKFTHRDIP
jgi:hypothetical protein